MTETPQAREKRLAVLDLYSKGMRDVAIALQLGLSCERVRQLRKDLALPRQAFKVIYVCHVCGCHMETPRMYCEKCLFELYHQTKPCEACGKPITRSKSLWRGNMAFCDRHCQGRWLGQRQRTRLGLLVKHRCLVCGGFAPLLWGSTRKGVSYRVYQCRDCGLVMRLRVKDGHERWTTKSK